MDILFLDDSKQRFKVFQRNCIGHNLTWVKTASDCIKKLRENRWDLVYLDYDLSEDSTERNGTGSQVTEFIVLQVRDGNEGFRNTGFVIHSLNPWGSKCMYLHLKKIGKIENVFKKPWGWQENP